MHDFFTLGRKTRYSFAGDDRLPGLGVVNAREDGRTVATNIALVWISRQKEVGARNEMGRKGRKMEPTQR